MPNVTFIRTVQYIKRTVVQDGITIPELADERGISLDLAFAALEFLCDWGQFVYTYDIDQVYRPKSAAWFDELVFNGPPIKQVLVNGA